jgi:hypothetical protein
MRESPKHSDHFVRKINRSVGTVPTPGRVWSAEEFAVSENRRLNPSGNPQIAKQIGLRKHPAVRSGLGGRNPRPRIDTL